MPAFAKLTRSAVLRLVPLLALLLISAGAATPWRLPPPPYVPIANAARLVTVWPGGERARPQAANSAAAIDTLLLSKAASATRVAPDGTLHYTLTSTNATPVTQTFHITDSLPAGLSYITGTASGGFVYNVGGNRLTATKTMSPFQGAVISTTGAPTYFELSGLGNVNNVCQLAQFTDCHNDAVTVALPFPFQYFGVAYTTITLDSNGFVMPGAPQPGALSTDDQNQNLPNTAQPNTVIAPFWDELDLNGTDPGDSGQGDWYYAVLHNGITQANYFVVEWHDAQKKGDGGKSYSFQVWVQLQAEHITFAYADPAFSGDTSSATVGFENSDGTLGSSYLYGNSGQVPAAGSTLGLVLNFDTRQLGFDARAQHSLRGCRSITNTASITNQSGILNAAASARVALLGPCEFLPVIYR
jgi:uncharacterized repeat protein (TIGR01451 family)